MRRPRRAGLGVLSPRRAPNLGKIRRRACLRLIPFPGTGDVLLAPTMISHPLAYVAPTTRHLAPTVGPGAPSSGDLFWTGTLFLPRERSQPCAPANPANSRPAQALGPLGRPLRRQQGTRQRLLLLDRRAKTKSTQERRLRQGVGATMERKPPKTILQLKSSM